MVVAEINQAGAASSSMEQSFGGETENSGDIGAIEWAWASETA
jgi:hypothetical protein